MTSSVVKDLPSTTSRDPSTAAVAPNDSKTTSITSNVKEGEVYRRADGVRQDKIYIYYDHKTKRNDRFAVVY